MMNSPQFRRLVSRAAANIVAVAAITAIFGLKTYIDHHGLSPVPRAEAAELAYIGAAGRPDSEQP